MASQSKELKTPSQNINSRGRLVASSTSPGGSEAGFEGGRRQMGPKLTTSKQTETYRVSSYGIMFKGAENPISKY